MSMYSSHLTRPYLLLVILLAAVTLSSPVRLMASDPGTNNWPMWGGTPDRNQVSNMKNVPSDWDVKTKKNIKWVAELGSQTYGNPVVAGGVVYLGTNNESPKDPNVKGDKGILKIAAEFGVGSGTVQRIKGEMATAAD